MRYLLCFLCLFLTSCISFPIYNTYFQNRPVEQKEICSREKVEMEKTGLAQGRG